MLILQAQNHRVKLRHASGETYCRLADEGSDADSIHLFPGAHCAHGTFARYSLDFWIRARNMPIQTCLLTTSVQRCHQPRTELHLRAGTGNPSS